MGEFRSVEEKAGPEPDHGGRHGNRREVRRSRAAPRGSGSELVPAPRDGARYYAVTIPGPWMKRLLELKGTATFKLAFFIWAEATYQTKRRHHGFRQGNPWVVLSDKVLDGTWGINRQRRYESQQLLADAGLIEIRVERGKPTMARLLDPDAPKQQQEKVGRD